MISISASFEKSCEFCINKGTIIFPNGTTICFCCKNKDLFHGIKFVLSPERKNQIREVLCLLKKEFNIRWDRCTGYEDFSPILQYYGWISKEYEVYKDFILIQFSKESLDNFDFYTTSSIKYSKPIQKLLSGNLEEHSNCLSIKEFFGMDINNL